MDMSYSALKTQNISEESPRTKFWLMEKMGEKQMRFGWIFQFTVLQFHCSQMRVAVSEDVSGLSQQLDSKIRDEIATHEF
jgi:hypothetical protein